MRYFCPACHESFSVDLTFCPFCGADIQNIINSRDYTEKLIASLLHPVPEIVMNAIWILGEIKVQSAVFPLIALAKETSEGYIARAVVKALGEIGTEDALSFIATLRNSESVIVRQEVFKQMKNHGLEE